MTFHNLHKTGIVDFVPGLQLARMFHMEVVVPILRREFPELRYAAALIGPGSEVLGFDTPMSTDHDWRPRVFLFLKAQDLVALGRIVEETLWEHIPPIYRGFATRAQGTTDVRSRIVYSLDTFWQAYLGIPASQALSPVDWLTRSEHRLLALTSGDIFEDMTGELSAARARIGYYPEDVRLYLGAAEWSHIAQEEAFLGRTGHVGDEFGSRLVAGRLVQHLVRLCFILERRYCPYSKWQGTSFARLDCGVQIAPLIENVLDQATWVARQEKMSELYHAVAELFAQQGLLEVELGLNVRGFHARPFKVIDAERFAVALRAKITSEAVLRLPPRVGSVDQFTASHEIQNNNAMRDALRGLYLA